jgi:heme o synthase
MHYQFTNAEVEIKPTWREYLEITKPGMVSMLVLCSLTTMFIAAQGLPEFSVVIATALGGFLASSGSCALNSYLERDLDSLVIRTRSRPLPAQRMFPKQAFNFGISLLGLSFIIMAVGTNLLASALTLVGVAIYVLVYTMWLKRRSIYSTFAGGVAGAFPVLVGWAAATGSLSVEVLIFFALIMYWTSAHHFALGLIHRNEYVKAALPVVPVIQGPNAARLQIGRYSVLVVVLSLLPVGLGLLDKYYAYAALPLGILLILNAVQLHLTPNTQSALRFYKHSLLYLALLMAAMLADRAIL